MRPLTRGALGVLAAARDGLLPGWYDDWVQLERERLRQLRLHALEQVAADSVRAGNYAVAVQAALEALRTEPLRETPHRLLVQAHLAEGNAFEALQAFYSYRELLRRELPLEPSPAMRALVDPVLAPLLDAALVPGGSLTAHAAAVQAPAVRPWGRCPGAERRLAGA